MAQVLLWFTGRKHQQYDCKWYIPLADLVFPSPEEAEASPHVHPFPDHELEDMKMKISALKSEIQKEVGSARPLSRHRGVGCFYWGPLTRAYREAQAGVVVRVGNPMRREEGRGGGLRHTRV